MKGSILDTIGSPLVQVDSPEGATVAAKVESFNPGGSAKDRPAVQMIRSAERDGEIEPGDWLVEPTSGNTGIGLALVCAARGYDLTIVMPADKSAERRRIMAAYGAELELIDGDMTDARKRADELEADGATQLGQFDNPANPDAHYRTTGEEIVEQVDEREVDAFVAGVGTGGTISGTGRRLREEFPDVEITAVEPARNPILSTGEPGSDEFQGMGPGFVSENLDRDLIDRVETVKLEDAEDECLRLAREEGVLVGQSSGATSLAAQRIAREIADPDLECPEVPGAFDSPQPASPETDGGELEDCPLVVTVFWDSGERYLSTGLFD
ncbi:PLP-dependent cysteine synthase family protein [Natrarchaeobius halalkaliphilus]|uniref:PLP-dependent cysteine synthase family protein n=1 Tax=Natrarchaeobius halalkaliphilus TaxID=1679091 RepID=A0A3N6P672_9EURY|nr:PLP-dependent cysteine synthase family protein [Natrarchaeobius halalkaliphilus]RQG91225.1 PLP-dependent cysteine synthase family protein [Natrarchaeobius halalkaliphilus]